MHEEREPWQIAQEQLRAEYARLVPWRSATELQDEVVWAYGRCEQVLREIRQQRKERAMQYLPQDHPEVVSLLAQLQAQHENIGKVSSFVGYTNVVYLRAELYKRGWNTRLAEDEKTVLLIPREE